MNTSEHQESLSNGKDFDALPTNTLENPKLNMTEQLLKPYKTPNLKPSTKTYPIGLIT